jgi:hypothetical protein
MAADKHIMSCVTVEDWGWPFCRTNHVRKTLSAGAFSPVVLVPVLAFACRSDAFRAVLGLFTLQKSSDVCKKIFPRNQALRVMVCRIRNTRLRVKFDEGRHAGITPAEDRAIEPTA